MPRQQLILVEMSCHGNTHRKARKSYKTESNWKNPLGVLELLNPWTRNLEASHQHLKMPNIRAKFKRKGRVKNLWPTKPIYNTLPLELSHPSQTFLWPRLILLDLVIAQCSKGIFLRFNSFLDCPRGHSVMDWASACGAFSPRHIQMVLLIRGVRWYENCMI